MAETRLDRIEKGIESLLQGISELRESQKKTDAQILELKESQKKTDEQLMKTDVQILELKESQKKTDAQIFELKESQKKTDAQILELKESQKKTDEQLMKTDAQIRGMDVHILELKECQKRTDEQLTKTIKRLDAVGKQLADMGLVQGEVAEDLFYRNVKNMFKKRELDFKDIRRNLKKKGKAEYDIVASAGEKVLVIEVKNKLDKRMVDNFINKKLPNFKKEFPMYQKYRLLGGIGALVVKDDVGRYAEKAGLFVPTQTDDGGAALINKKGFKAKEF